MTLPAAKQSVVYRMFDAKGTLLYVGCSISPANRIPQHGAKPWWPDVVRIDVEHFASCEAAGKAEKQAIETEGALHNRMIPKHILTDAQRAARRARREREQERRWAEHEKLNRETYHLKGLHCTICTWGNKIFGARVTKGRDWRKAKCPKCGCVSLAVEPAKRKAAA